MEISSIELFAALHGGDEPCGEPGAAEAPAGAVQLGNGVAATCYS